MLNLRSKNGQKPPPSNGFQPLTPEAAQLPEGQIQLKDLTKVYESAAGEFPALKKINATIYPGTFSGIIGKSGAGKSTLLNMITGVDRLTAGEVWVGATRIDQMTENQLALWRGMNIGVVYQSFQLLPNLSLLDNVLLPMDFCSLYKPRQSRQRAMALLEQVEIAEHAHKPPSRISGGQQQRVAIARALANDPQIIVADEPTGNLDSATAETIIQLFEALVDQGKTIVMVTHDASLAGRFTHSFRIADGRLRPERTPASPQPNGASHPVPAD